MTDKNPVSTDLDDLRTKRELLRREEIYRSILLAAEKVLLAKGYTAMTMDDVAREACLSKATLYKYIDSKYMILFEIISRYLDDAVMLQCLLTAQVEFLPKPFTRSTLVAKVREVLDK